jgi:DNA-binding NarL/FixJ family response regulator
MIDKDLYIQFLEQLVKGNSSPVVLKSVGKRTRRPIHKWSASDRERLMRLHNDGLKVKEIANIMGLRRQQVDNQLYTILRRNQVA